MNKIYYYIGLFFLLISGCNYKVNENTNLIQKIDNLDMIIYTNKGEKLYSIIALNQFIIKMRIHLI